MLADCSLNMATKLTSARRKGLAYYAYITDRRLPLQERRGLPPVRNFSHDPRVIVALLDSGLIERHEDAFSHCAGPTFRITAEGQKVLAE